VIPVRFHFPSEDVMAIKERRRAKRISAQLSITISAGPGEAQGETLNISTNGVYFRSPYFIEPLTKVELTLMIPHDGKEQPVNCNGIVVRVEPERETPDVDSYNIAVFFTSLPKQSEKILASYIMSKLS